MIKATEVINHSDVKVVLLGPGGVGKTCITMRYIKGEFDEYYDPSSRNSFYKKYNINGEVGVLELLDTGGQEDYVSITDDWIRQGMAFLLVYSIDSTYTFENIESILKRIKQIREGEKMPVVVIGNKCDLESEREVSQQEGQDLASKHGCKWIETSAKINKNIDQCIEMVLSMVINKMNKQTNKAKNNPDNSDDGICHCLFSLCSLV